MELSFAGKKVLVTGAGKGIGYDLCLALSSYGADVYALSRTQSDLDKLVLQDSKIRPICLDVQDFGALQKVVDGLPSDLTLLVNNAAVAILQHFLEVTEEAYESTMNINVKSMLFLSQMVAKRMIANGKGGSIVNVSSQASVAALPNHTSYCVSKAAVDHLTRMMAMELGPYQIRVNAVNPTVVLTAMGRKAWDGPSGIPMKNQIPLQKFAEIRDVVNAVVYLLSDKSDMINGTILPIDGGFLACRTMK